jgi:hypothetical protein
LASGVHMLTAGAFAGIAFDGNPLFAVVAV